MCRVWTTGGSPQEAEGEETDLLVERASCLEELEIGTTDTKAG